MAAVPAVALGRIGQIFLNVKDLKRATAFYRDTLGMKFLFEAPNLAFFDCGGIRLMLGLAILPEYDHPASILYYRVDDIQATSAALISHGVPVAEEPRRVARLENHDLWLAFLRDSENNVFALMSEVPRA